MEQAAGAGLESEPDVDGRVGRVGGDWSISLDGGDLADQKPDQIDPMGPVVFEPVSIASPDQLNGAERFGGEPAPKVLVARGIASDVVHGQDDPPPLCLPDQRTGLVEVEREGLLHQDGPNRRRIEDSIEHGRVSRVRRADADNLRTSRVEQLID